MATPTESSTSRQLLTPRESSAEDPDHEPPSSVPQMAGRKRNADEMEDRETPKPLPLQKMEWRIECPDNSKGRNKKGVTGDVFRDRDHPGNDKLTVDYAVRPGKKWSETGKYRNAKFNDPISVTYSVGDIIYVNHATHIPSPPPEGASEEEKLRYDIANLWVGQIQEFRAINAEKVYLRVFWLYWPEELPFGRQPYHSRKELVMSNHAEIIEAQSISSHTDIARWDEKDDSKSRVVQERERFWRQFYDIRKTGQGPKAALTPLRRYCICNGFENPDVPMFQCPKSTCETWNHQQCISKDLEAKAWEAFQAGRLAEWTEEGKSIAEKLTDLVKKNVLGSTPQPPDPVVPETIAVGATDKRKSNKAKGKKEEGRQEKAEPWTGKLDVAISADGSEAIITQLVPTADGKEVNGFDAITRTVKVHCLKCGTTL